jgi:hypothetical protein
MTRIEGVLVYLSPTQLASAEHKFGPDIGEQLKGAGRKIQSVEFKILGSGPGLAIKDDPTDPRLKDLHRMATIWDRLVKRGEVGTVDQPGVNGYFDGRMTLHYDSFRHVDPPVMYLTGLTEQTLLVLAGSFRHFFGHEDTQAYENAQSVMFEPEVVRAVADAQRRNDPKANVDQTYDAYGPDIEGDRTPFDAASGYGYWEYTTELDFVFLAKVEKRYTGPYKLGGTRSDRVSVLVGAPIMVAKV